MSGMHWAARGTRGRTVIPLAPLGKSRVAIATTWCCCYGEISKPERKKRDEALVRAARASREPERP